MAGVLEPLAGDPASRSAEDAEEWAWVESVIASDGLTGETDQALEDQRLLEVVRLVRAALPNATVQAIRDYLQMLDDRREAQRKLAMRGLVERLPDPKPASLGQRLGPSPGNLAAAIVDALRHERW